MKNKMTRKAYVYEGISGWDAAFWMGTDEVRYLHGFASSAEAVRAIAEHWDNPPLYQNGFPTSAYLEAQ